jgi:hypothetical protein
VRLCRSRLLKTGKSLGPTVAECLTSDFHSVSHSLLATMPCDEAVTTNYDRLFEQACDCCDPGSLSVLPISPKPHAPRWLLKMHGCVTHPADIVLTRKDYIRYAENSAALGGGWPVSACVCVLLSTCWRLLLVALRTPFQGLYKR